MHCVACDKIIDDYASDQDLCYVCLSKIDIPLDLNFVMKSGKVRVLTKEEIDIEYNNNKEV